MKKLEELLNVDATPVQRNVTQEEFNELIAKADQIIQIDEIINEPQNIQQHEREMDSFSDRALVEYERLLEIASNMEERNSAPVFQTAVTMFKNALDAKINKANMKLKAADLLMKKRKLDGQLNKDGPQTAEKDDSVIVNRNQILRVISEKPDNSSNG